MQCKSRKLRLLQNKTKCIVLKVKPWLPGFLGSRWTHWVTFQTKILETAKEYQKLAFFAEDSQMYRPNFSMSQGWGGWVDSLVEPKERISLSSWLYKLNISGEDNYIVDYLWHQQPNLPACVAHPTQHPPVETDMSWVDKQRNTRDKFFLQSSLKTKHTFCRGALAWTGRQWWWRHTSPCSWPRQQPGRSPGAFPNPCRSLAGRWRRNSWVRVK